MAQIAQAPRRALVLIGFMGAGKSTVAAELAGALGSTALDSDPLLEERLGHTIAEEFERADGEQSFRAKEEELVCELLAGATSGSVIALGGGSVLSERVRRALEPHVVVWLDVEAEQAWARVRAGARSGVTGAQPTDAAAGEPRGAERPLARDREAFVALHHERRAVYEQLADAHLPSLARGTASRTLGALSALAQCGSDARMVWATSAAGDYPVLVGRGLLRASGAGGLGQPWPLVDAGSRAFCVTDETVRGLYGELLSELTHTIAIAPGEASKTLASAERVWRALVAAGMTRADHVVALGGGVVGDLAGFCAATYQRGVPVVQMPTTLLAQVDSAYGGKTGVDLSEAKNYVGAYHQPAGVLVDPDALTTLPAGELASGWVEVLKTALIAGGALWDGVAHGADVDAAMILACARTKLAIVAADERDAGRRRLLNLGHTVGHAIETATGYARYRHGEAVGLGLLAALRLSAQEDLRAQVRELLLAHGLPVTLSDAPAEPILEAIARDKKRMRSRVPFVLLDGPGRPRIDCDVAVDEVRAAIAELGAGTAPAPREPTELAR
jgi:shikimate kinase/3-dehydroquinate synthase